MTTIPNTKSWTNRTEQQKSWLAQHPEYEPVGWPRAGVYFTETGTLYPDGTFVKLKPMEPVRLTSGPPYAVCVGIKA